MKAFRSVPGTLVIIPLGLMAYTMESTHDGDDPPVQTAYLILGRKQQFLTSYLLVWMFSCMLYLFTTKYKLRP